MPVPGPATGDKAANEQEPWKDFSYYKGQQVTTVAGLTCVIVRPVTHRIGTLARVRYTNGLEVDLELNQLATHEIRLGTSSARTTTYYVNAPDGFTAIYRAGLRGPSNAVVQGVVQV